MGFVLSKLLDPAFAAAAPAAISSWSSSTRPDAGDAVMTAVNLAFLK